MPRFRITVAYDGGGFVGWQRQPAAAGSSIQGLLEDALGELDGNPVTVLGAGRTDAGVHALGQVAAFTLARAIAADVVVRALNVRLPDSVRVLTAEQVLESFNKRGIDDPAALCLPLGVPRVTLVGLFPIQIVQTPKQVLMLYQNTRTFRTIWLDRELPKPAEITEPRWFGYSVGKWTDPTTLVVTTTGLDESTWIDNVGRPHSDQLVVEETYHRVDELNIDLTVKITDPVMYTQPWFPLKNFRLGMNSPDFDIREMICSVSQQALFNQLLKNTTDAAADKPEK